MDRDDAAALLVWPTFAASTEKTRVYLGGVLLRDDEGRTLTAVAIDGYRASCGSRVPGATGLSSDFGLIVPNTALRIVAKLLAEQERRARHPAPLADPALDRGSALRLRLEADRPKVP